LRRPNNPAMPIGPDWIVEVGRDLTAVGGVAVLLLATLAVAGFLLLDRKLAAMGFVLAAVASGLVVSSLLKACFARPRPDVVPHLSLVYTSSFPSGHSMMSAIVYLTLGALLARTTTRRPLRFYFLAVALLLTGLVGASRVYMGVHYPTDVLAGWAAGLVWATLCWLVARRLQHRGTIEKHL
jgi:undecaprenyl-diphosphatase